MEEINDTKCLHKPEEEEDDHHEAEEEALSLCDLPLNADGIPESSSNQNRRSSSSDPPELFEFFSAEFSAEIERSSDDHDIIIFCGKLISLNEHGTSIDQSIPKFSSMEDQRRRSVVNSRKRSESLSELRSSVSMSNSTKSKVIMRTSRSLDYRKLHRPSSSSSTISPEPEVRRNSSTKSVEKKISKPRWYLMLMFGMVKLPAEMELQDIKNRQVRRNPSTLFPATEHCRYSPVNRSSGKVSWSLLRALSCKEYASVAVTTPFSQKLP